MRADDLAQAFVAALEADTALITALGGQPAIYRAGANRAPVIPSLEWRRITNTLAENTEVILVQFDVWAKSTTSAGAYSVAMAIEARLRAVLTGQARVVTLGSLPLFADLSDSRDHDDPEPGVVHTSLDIRFEPAKDEV